MKPLSLSYAVFAYKLNDSYAALLTPSPKYMLHRMWMPLKKMSDKKTEVLY